VVAAMEECLAGLLRIFVFSRLFFLSAGVIAFGACGRGGDPSGRSVRIAIGGQNQLIYLPTILARELGFYRAEGLDVELQDLAGGSKALEALIGGSAYVVWGFCGRTVPMAAQ